ncbi:50S ribosomal protein L1 [Stetteria hydrogenophila]
MSFVAEETLVESIRKALELGKRRRFKQSVDLIVVFRGLDVKGPEGRIREIVYLPRKPSKEARVCVVAEGDMAVKAKELGLPVYTRADLQEFRKDRKKAKKVAQQCDWVLVRVDLMGLAGASLGPALGPRGKAPTPVPLNADIAQLVERYKRAVWVRVRGQPQVMCRVGTEDMKPEDIAENVKAVLSTLEGRVGRQKIARVIIKRTMGIPVEVPLL